MLRLSDILELPVVRRALPDVVAGSEGLDRELRWAHVIELAEPDDVLKGGELVLTTGIGAGARERDQRRWIRSLIAQGAAAVAVVVASCPSTSSAGACASSINVHPRTSRRHISASARAAQWTLRRVLFHNG
jgi:hypothetical protein